MKTDEVRRVFCDFFASKGHKILPSSSLVPLDDPTLLFTNAGMVQFKKYFLGELEPEWKNVATVQRCIRAGGKHNDLEDVGKTSRHMTFFEMLGNFSFGGYFKKEAIKFAWELVTEVFRIPKEKIFATVYEEDDEAEKIWREETDVREIFRLGKEDNFWTMGDEGPAGPCSEIIVDRGEKFSEDHDCKGISCGCDRYLEIWNLVFMQYNLKPDGTLEPLARKNIDTGMGLERISMVLQGVDSVFDTDVFLPLKEVISSEVRELLSDQVATRIVLDASRASAFAIADGIMPSNESRGYVIRRIIRRALRYSLQFTDSPFLYKVAGQVAESMSDFWTHLKDKKNLIEKTVRIEEERFFETLSRVLPLFTREVDEIKKGGGDEIPAEMIFMYWDTHGLPLEIMQEIAEEKGLRINDKKLSELFERRRKESKGREREKEGERKIFEVLSKSSEKTEFLGYSRLSAESDVVRIFDESGEAVSKASPKEKKRYFVVVRETPFYPEGGGQVGDRGVITWEGGKALVRDTKKLGDFILHTVEIKEGELHEGVRVQLSVDRSRRIQTARHHTTTHLLHSALRKILGTHARQMGSLVEPARLRFDFSHPTPLSESELKDIEALINEWIMRDYDVSHRNMKFEDAIRAGALAFFGDKYGKVVRVVEIGDVSLELCGGTHLGKTGEAGMLKIVREGSVASGIRRVEAVAGHELINYIESKEKYMEEIARVLGVSPSELLPRIKGLLEEKRRLESEVSSLRRKLVSFVSSPIIKEVDGTRLIFDFVEGFGKNEVAVLVDNLREKFKDSVVVVMGEKEGKIFIAGGVSGSVDKNAGDIVRHIARFLGGGGGGKREFAEGGGKVKKPKDEILKELEKILKES